MVLFNFLLKTKDRTLHFIYSSSIHCDFMLGDKCFCFQYMLTNDRTLHFIYSSSIHYDFMYLIKKNSCSFEIPCCDYIESLSRFHFVVLLCHVMCFHTLISMLTMSCALLNVSLFQISSEMGLGTPR